MWGAAGFLLGLVLGSFVKVLADRSLTNQSFWGRSYCAKCKKKLQWYDLFPIFSYLSTGGRCRHCGDRIGVEYPVVEVVMGVLIGYLFFQAFSNFKFEILSFSIELILKTFFICVLAVLFITDLKKMFIPDRIVIPALKIGFVALLSFTIYKVGYLYYYLSESSLGRLLLPPKSEYFQRHAIYIAEPFLYALLTGLLIGGFFLAIIILTRGKGMGGGDVKLGAFMGLMLGFPNALVALMLSFLTGALFSIILIIFGKKHFGQTIPFGPFLVIGALIALFWGEKILNWYLSLSYPY